MRRAIASCEILTKLMPATKKRLAELTGVRHSTICYTVEVMHASGRCHIESWTYPPLGRPIAVFAAGPGADAPQKRNAITERRRYLKCQREGGVHMRKPRCPRDEDAIDIFPHRPVDVHAVIKAQPCSVFDLARVL